ncbi:MAG: sulfatase family protein [Roseibacillus sp.]
MKTTLFTATLLTTSLLLSANERPNIVFIMADDLGLGDVAFHRKNFQQKDIIVPTPNIDALAEQALWFTDGHSSTALCSPTRYCAMTGNHNYRSYAPWGVWGAFRESPIKKDDATLGTVTRDAGYTTAFIGKWHLGGDFYTQGTQEIYRSTERGNPDFKVDVSQWIGGNPKSFGFDYDFTLPCGIQGPVYTAYENGTWAPFSSDSTIVFLNKDNALDPRFISDKGPGPGDSHWNTKEVGPLLANKAAAFIKKQSREQPFFLCYWSPNVHLPHCPPEEINGVKIAGQTPTAHLDTILDLDQQVKTITDALKKSGAFENTLLIFTSDNGGLNDGPAQKAGHASNGGFRGTKNAPHEGGHRVPFFATWPGIIQPGTSDAVVTTHDVLATIAAAAGKPVTNEQAPDSLNFLHILKGKSKNTGRKEVLLQGGSKNELIFRQGQWKLIIQSNHKLSKFEPTGLFNLSDNVKELEKDNLIQSPEYQSRVQTMLTRYLDLRKTKAPTAQ